MAKKQRRSFGRKLNQSNKSLFVGREAFRNTKIPYFSQQNEQGLKFNCSNNSPLKDKSLLYFTL